MKIIGELNRCFGNFVTLRGFAKMGDLDRISFPDEAYQRDLVQPHHEKMVRFLQDGNYSFFPELVFSAVLAEDEKQREKAYNFYNAVPYQGYRKTNFGQFSVQAKIIKTVSRGGDIRGGQGYCIGEFTPINADKHILQRIDGNHRLSATKKAGAEETIVPFCILLYTDRGSAYKSNRVLFNNINFQQLPLTMEENLLLLFGKNEESSDAYTFSDKELTETPGMGREYALARLLFNKIRLDNLDAISSILMERNNHKFTRTFLLESSKLLIDSNTTVSPEEFQKVLKAVEHCYGQYPGNYSKDYKLLAAHVHYGLSNKLDSFFNWVENNRMYLLRECAPQAIISIFNNVMDAKEKTIFLAMSFDDEATQNKDAIEAAVKDLNTHLNAGLKLEIIRIDELTSGNSFEVVNKILKYLENAGYLIADLSLGNQNVYFELGYRMGFNAQNGNAQENFLIVHNKAVGDFDQDAQFNIKHYRIEIANDSHNLREKVKNQIKVYYNL